MAKDFTKYIFNGHSHHKNRLVLAVIKEYVKNDAPNLQELLEAFPNELQGTRGIFIDKTKYDALPENSDDKKNNRYFSKEDEIISVTDGELLITTQWGIDNVSRFVDKAFTLGIDIQGKSDENNKVYWFLGASYGGVDDQTERFIKEGIWQGGNDGKYTDKIKQIQKGDKIAIKSVYTQTHSLPFDNGGKMASVMDIKAIGVVTENLNDGKTVKVDWQPNFKKLTWYMYTYQKRIWRVLPDKPERKALIDFAFSGAKQDFELFMKNNNESFVNSDEQQYPTITQGSLNKILYGPPGTGKTYNTIVEAVNAAEPGFSPEDGSIDEIRAEYQEQYDDLVAEGRIRFVTFHQSYGYEEFVEGLKASSDDGNISYDVEDGIFKGIARQAEKFLNSKASESTYNFDNAWLAFTELFSEEDYVEVNMSKTSFKVLDFNDKRIFFEKRGGSQDHTLSISTLRAIFEGRREYKSGLGVYYRPLVKFLKEISAPQQMPAVERKNFVLVIDEINRGNISKIFGELITLIEPSKRLGQKESLEVVLPYSGDKFSVPDNLYIIGTMNTADRSLAMMDTALRRRFDFVEMMPKSELFAGKSVKGIKLDLLLSKMNERIEVLYDREHTLGHAFFMPVADKVDFEGEDKAFEELQHVFRNKIIPLLEEYFFEDWNKIRLVLGDNRKKSKALTPYVFIKKHVSSYNDIFGEDHGLETYEDKKTTFKLADFDNEHSAWHNHLAYQAIYDETVLKKVDKASVNEEPATGEDSVVAEKSNA